jgi:RNA polymerase sigma factor (TIGR02999 family)
MVVADDRDVLDHVYSLAYEELRRLARAVLRSDREASLTPTSLVNEAWIKLARSPEVAHTSPLHFRRIAARAMRQVLVEAARRRQSQIRGGGQPNLTFDESLTAVAPIKQLNDLLELDSALLALSNISPRQAKLVEGRFFGGLSWAESAESLAISEATVMREWRAARAWLGCELRRERQQPNDPRSGSIA